MASQKPGPESCCISDFAVKTCVRLSDDELRGEKFWVKNENAHVTNDTKKNSKYSLSLTESMFYGDPVHTLLTYWMESFSLLKAMCAHVLTGLFVNWLERTDIPVIIKLRPLFYQWNGNPYPVFIHLLSPALLA